MGGAVVKARYGRGQDAIAAAKDHVRYIVHRPDPWGRVAYRDLWGSLQVDKRAAYDELDQATAAYVYRVVVSPDPRQQDVDQVLDLRAFSAAAMAEAEAAHPDLRWFAVEHQDQDHRHVHVVALTHERLGVDDFRAMRAAADDNAREQLRQRERSQDLERDR
jgi:S-formylglutathione hydrolase FrmB